MRLHRRGYVRTAKAKSGSVIIAQHVKAQAVSRYPVMPEQNLSAWIVNCGAVSGASAMNNMFFDIF